MACVHNLTLKLEYRLSIWFCVQQMALAVVQASVVGFALSNSSSAGTKQLIVFLGFLYLHNLATVAADGIITLAGSGKGARLAGRRA